MSIIHLKLKERDYILTKILQHQEGICPILNRKSHNMVIDHIHRKKQTDPITETSGVIRGCIDNGANCLLGVIENNYRRYITQDIPLSDILRNMADYIEKGAYKDDEGNVYSHWKENCGGDLIKSKHIPYRIADFNKYEKYCKANNRKMIPFKKWVDSKIVKEFNDCGIKMTSLLKHDVENFEKGNDE